MALVRSSVFLYLLIPEYSLYFYNNYWINFTPIICNIYLKWKYTHSYRKNKKALAYTRIWE